MHIQGVKRVISLMLDIVREKETLTHNNRRTKNGKGEIKIIIIDRTHVDNCT